MARFLRARRPTCEIDGFYTCLLLFFLVLYACLLLRVKAALLRFTRPETKAWGVKFTHPQLIWEMEYNLYSLMLSPP